MDFEASLLIKQMKGRKKKGPFTSGAVGGSPVVHGTSGMGCANASRGATLLIEKFSPAMVVLFGIGGAYPSTGLGPGDLAAAKSEVYADLGVLTRSGFLPVEATGIPLVRKGRKKYFGAFPLDRRLLSRAAACLVTLNTGVFLTVATVTGTRAKALELRKRHKALCENMEGAAVAQVCAIYGIPLLEIRGISNMVEDRDAHGWEKGLAAVNCQRAVLELIQSGCLL